MIGFPWGFRVDEEPGGAVVARAEELLQVREAILRRHRLEHRQGDVRAVREAHAHQEVAGAAGVALDKVLRGHLLPRPVGGAGKDRDHREAHLAEFPIAPRQLLCRLLGRWSTQREAFVSY